MLRKDTIRFIAGKSTGGLTFDPGNGETMRSGEEQAGANCFQAQSASGTANLAFLEEVLQHWRLIEHLPAVVMVYAPDTRILLANPAAERLFGISADRLEGRTIAEIPFRLLREDGTPLPLEDYPVNRVLRSGRAEESFIVGIDRGSTVQCGWALVNAYPEYDGSRLLQRVVVTSVEITRLKLAEQESSRHMAELEVVKKLSSDLRSAQTLEEILPILLDTTLTVMRVSIGAIWLYDPVDDELKVAIARGYEKEAGLSPPEAEKPGQGIVGRVFVSGEPDIIRDLRADERLPESVRRMLPASRASLAVAIRMDTNSIGTFTVDADAPRTINVDDVRLLSTLCEIAGIAIQRTTLREQTEHRLQHVSALSEMDRVIASSFDLHVSLPSLVRQVVQQLTADAADILLYNPGSQRLEFFAGHGFRAKTIEGTRLPIGEGLAGLAVLDRRIVHVPDLRERPEQCARQNLLADEDFLSYYGVPLIAKGEVKGVLEVFQRTPLRTDREWVDFLDALAGQAALAIDNITLFEGLQRSNAELELAYDATIEGWSHALDLRDKETEGHTQRVADMTIRLCRVFGLTESELVHVRRGALLHDIGKMGVPDNILLKPGPLTEEEWTVMRKHPTFAYEMLSPIEYLRPALDIPRFHHEKWDGSGYPCGLKGEQIPLVARIFAVVDVWDALTSDRPYRPAWPKERVHEHIGALSGTHFDPEVARRCLMSGILA